MNHVKNMDHIYNCELCNYHINDKIYYEKHLKSTKHRRNLQKIELLESNRLRHRKN